jgi:hypothetical protein
MVWSYKNLTPGKTSLRGSCMCIKEEAMDLERLEWRVLSYPLQELRVELASGIYTLGNDPAKPAWWSIMHEPSRQFYKERRLKNMIALIEQTYPDLYAWLVRFSHDGEDESRDWFAGERLLHG